jgi:hypothetical protein
MDGSLIPRDVISLILEMSNEIPRTLTRVCKLWRDVVKSIKICIFYNEHMIHLRYSDPFFKLCHNISRDSMLPLVDITVVKINDVDVYLEYLSNRKKTLMQLQFQPHTRIKYDINNQSKLDKTWTLPILLLSP